MGHSHFDCTFQAEISALNGSDSSKRLVIQVMFVFVSRYSNAIDRSTSLRIKEKALCQYFFSFKTNQKCAWRIEGKRKMRKEGIALLLMSVVPEKNQGFKTHT